MSQARGFFDELERVFTNAPRRVEQAARIVNGAAGAVRQVSNTLEPAIRLYRETHGGQSPGRVEYVEVPDEDGGSLVEMGQLVAVAYLTNKDRPRGGARSSSSWVSAKRPDLFIHDFERPYPTLAFRTESRDLVIVRGADRSRYTVQEEGIDR